MSDLFNLYPQTQECATLLAHCQSNKNTKKYPFYRWTWQYRKESKEWNYHICTKIKHPHDDVIKWKHFPRYWPFVRGIQRSPVNSPHKGQWHGAFHVFFDLRLNKRLSKQCWGWWFETPSRPLWRHSCVGPAGSHDCTSVEWSGPVDLRPGWFQVQGGI